MVYTLGGGGWGHSVLEWVDMCAENLGTFLEPAFTQVYTLSIYGPQVDLLMMAQHDYSGRRGVGALRT